MNECRCVDIPPPRNSLDHCSTQRPSELKQEPSPTTANKREPPSRRSPLPASPGPCGAATPSPSASRANSPPLDVLVASVRVIVQHAAVSKASPRDDRSAFQISFAGKGGPSRPVLPNEYVAAIFGEEKSKAGKKCARQSPSDDVKEREGRTRRFRQSRQIISNSLKKSGAKIDDTPRLLRTTPLCRALQQSMNDSDHGRPSSARQHIISA